jgi:hypothetical protein
MPTETSRPLYVFACDSDRQTHAILVAFVLLIPVDRFIDPGGVFDKNAGMCWHGQGC